MRQFNILLRTANSWDTFMTVKAVPECSYNIGAK